jgi:hypothetical protein
MCTFVNRIGRPAWNGCPFIVCALALAVLLGAPPAHSRSNERDQQGDAAAELNIDELISAGVSHILQKQEGENNAEWPYEGVYRVDRQIPIGYRVGGTAICASALVYAPGYAQDPARQQAVHRAMEFIVAQIRHPLMNPEYQGGYDVRGWGYTYGLGLLLTLEKLKLTPEDMRDQVRAAIEFYIDAIERIEIPECGGWNYSRRDIKTVSPPSPFMTAPTLLVLFEAHGQGFEVDPDVVERGLKCLEKARTPTGSFRYAGLNGEKSEESVPGSVGRMLASEATLFLAGRSDPSRIRGALDAFIVHWQWLEQRRRQQGTHVPPYGIAPYYFFYAHYYAARAIELLPEYERAEYRRRVNQLLVAVRSPDGSWNDRVFDRSSNYGTAMALLSLMAPQIEATASWHHPQPPIAKE